jgi:hypothetical protein
MDYATHLKIFGKNCFNCLFCCADTEPETAFTHYWCSKEKRIIMKRIAVLNSFCNEWEIRKEEE